jgi:hypothetical protein
MDPEEIRLRIVENLLQSRATVENLRDPCKITAVADVLFTWITQKGEHAKAPRRRSGVENG